MVTVGFAVVNFVPAKIVLPTLCFCRQLQTESYAIVNGSYVPTGDTKQSSKVEVLQLLVCQFLVGKISF